MEIDDLSVFCRSLPRRRVRSDGHDLSASNRDRLRHRIAGINRDDLSIYQKIIAGRGFNGLRPGGNGREG